MIPNLSVFSHQHLGIGCSIHSSDVSMHQEGHSSPFRQCDNHQLSKQVRFSQISFLQQLGVKHPPAVAEEPVHDGLSYCRGVECGVGCSIREQAPFDRMAEWSLFPRWICSPPRRTVSFGGTCSQWRTIRRWSW